MKQNAGLFVLHILAFNPQQNHLHCIAGGRSLGTYTHISYVTEYMRVGRNSMTVIWKLLIWKEISENIYEWVIIVCFGAPCSLMKESEKGRKSH